MFAVNMKQFPLGRLLGSTHVTLAVAFVCGQFGIGIASTEVYGTKEQWGRLGGGGGTSNEKGLGKRNVAAEVQTLLLEVTWRLQIGL